MEHFEIYWKSHDGLDIFAQGWEPDNRPAKAVVCLVHGIGEHTGRYAHVGEAFSKGGYVLFGPDLRGHGRSSGPRGHFPSAAAVEKDLDQHLEEARKRYPGLPLVLYGHSLGGIFVLYYGLKRKPDIKGIIATGPGLRTALQDQQAKVLAARMLGLFLPRVSFPSGLDASAICRDEKVVQAYKNDPLVHNRMSLGFARMMLGINRYTLEHAGEFSLPLLLMHGMEDTIAFPSGSADFAAPLDKKCTLVCWNGVSHELHNEPEQAEVLKTMTDWMDEQLRNEHGVRDTEGDVNILHASSLLNRSS